MNDIISKLKIDNYHQKLILNKPGDITEFDNTGFDTKMKKAKYDLIFAFIFSLGEFKELLQTVVRKDVLNLGGYLYFAYPKKGNKVYEQYIGRDDFFPSIKMDKEGYVLDSPVKFAKMVAFNEVFTVIGLKHEAKRKTSKPSQRVTDYESRVPDLQKHFIGKKKILDFFNNLTPGYQRDWARYVYSAQTEATVSKRLLEMEDILKQGYKSKDLFRQKKK